MGLAIASIVVTVVLGLPPLIWWYVNRPCFDVVVNKHATSSGYDININNLGRTELTLVVSVIAGDKEIGSIRCDNLASGQAFNRCISFTIRHWDLDHQVIVRDCRTGITQRSNIFSAHQFGFRKPSCRVAILDWDW